MTFNSDEIFTVEDMDAELDSLGSLVLGDPALSEAEEATIRATHDMWPGPKPAENSSLPQGWRIHKKEESPPTCMGCGASMRYLSLSLQSIFNGETTTLSATTQKSKEPMVCFSHKDTPKKLVCIDCVPMKPNPVSYKSSGQVQLPKRGES